MISEQMREIHIGLGLLLGLVIGIAETLSPNRTPTTYFTNTFQSPKIASPNR